MIEPFIHVRGSRIALGLAIGLVAAVGIAGCDTTQKTAAPAAAPIHDDPFTLQATPDGAAPPLDDAERFARQVEQAAASEASAAVPDARANQGGQVQWDRPLGTVAERTRSGAAPANAAQPPVEQPPVAAIATAPAPAPEPSPPAAEPAPATHSELVTQLADRLKRDSDSGQLRAYLARAALTLSDPARELTAQDVAPLEPEDRRLVLAYQRAFTQLARSMGGSSDEDRTQLQLAAEELAEQINADRKLTLRSAKLCRKVSGYGQYEAFDRPVFLAGREHPAIVYAELDNFTSRPQDNGSYLVQLTQEITLYNESDGLAVWKVRPQQIVDHSMNRRRDFFLVQVVRLPAQLTVGKYVLKLTVTDDLGQAVDETTVPIDIVADRKLATP